jgi:hypothetical protein
LTVGTVGISGEGAGGGLERASLDCSFEVEKSTAREPNTASVKIWNLSQDHRRAIERTAQLALTIEAGYAGATTVIFSGDVRVAQSAPGVERRRAADKTKVRGARDDVDIITEIEAEDGGTAYRTATVQQSFGRGTPVADVLRAAARAMGVGEGNVSSFASDATLGDVRVYTDGTVLSGLAHREMDRIVRGCGLTWSIQSGALQLQRAGQALATRAVRLAPSTGLVGSPSMDADGYVEAVSLLNGALYPGRPVVLESRDIEGSFAVRRVRHAGETAGTEWYSHCILEAR